MTATPIVVPSERISVFNPLPDAVSLRGTALMMMEGVAP